MNEITRSLSFDSGIERVIAHDELRPAGLPASQRALPGEAVVAQRLNEVLYPPSIEQALAEALRPDVQDREVLTPGGYRQALDDSAAQLRAAAGAAADPADRAALEAGLAILREDAGLRDLLATYRNLLHRA